MFYVGPKVSERTIKCRSCGSDKLNKFRAEIAIHFHGLSDLRKPIVWIFPELLVCLNCGSAEFVVPDEELRVLAKGEPDVSEDDTRQANPTRQKEL